MGVLHRVRHIPSATALLGLSFASGCGDDGGGGGGSIVGNWQLYQIIDDEGAVYSFPLVYDDLNYGCTVTQNLGLEITSPTMGNYTGYYTITDCDDPANDTMMEYSEPISIEMGGSGYLIMVEGGDVLDCALTSELTCVDTQSSQYSFRRG